jgi:hypothetical protein
MPTRVAAAGVPGVPHEHCSGVPNDDTERRRTRADGAHRSAWTRRPARDTLPPRHLERSVPSGAARRSNQLAAAGGLTRREVPPIEAALVWPSESASALPSGQSVRGRSYRSSSEAGLLVLPRQSDRSPIRSARPAIWASTFPARIWVSTFPVSGNGDAQMARWERRHPDWGGRTYRRFSCGGDGWRLGASSHGRPAQR